MKLSRTCRGAQNAANLVACAVQSLTTLEPSCSYASSLEQAASLLKTLDASQLDRDNRAHLRGQLSALARQTAVAGTLLDSAAGWYFGNLVQNASFQAGYGPDGALAKTAEGAIHIQA